MLAETMEDRSAVNPEVSVLVNDFLQYKLSQSGFQWSGPYSERDAGRTITKAGIALRSLADEFSMHFKDRFVEMCDKIEINEVTLKPTIDGIANELFSEGIKWTRIVTFLVFCSELAEHCKEHNWPNLINVIAYSLSSYISEKLLPWINDHGGWEGLITFREGDNAEQSNGRWPSVKNLFYFGFSALGAALSIGAFLKKS